MSQCSLSTQEALEVMANAFNEPIEKLLPETPRASIPGWDSMGALLLIAELDERLGLELPAEVSREMKRVQHMLDFLAEQGVLTL